MNYKKTFIIGFLAALFLITAPENHLAAEQELETGFEKREEGNGGIIEDDDSWTTHQEELDFLADLESKYDHVKLEEIGKAGNGMPLHLITIGYSIPETEKEIDEEEYIFMQGGFHGNEPAGRESILKTMRNLASSNDQEIIDMLTESTFIFIPTVNPYGRDSNIRRNIDDVDLNRDQIQLNSPEARAIAETQKKYQPILFLDAHERVSGPNMSILGALNPNVDDQMASLNDSLLEDYLFPSLEGEDLTSDYYPGSSSPRNIRNLSSLKHSIVLLQETSRADVPSTRVRAHMVGIDSLIEYIQDKKEEIISTIAGSKERNAEIGENRSEPYYLDGKIGEELPEDKFILDPPPYGYFISKYHYETVKQHLYLFSIDAEEKENGYYISMAQPMRSLIPYLFDKQAEQRLLSGKAIYDLEEIDEIEFPEYPVKINEKTTFDNAVAGEFPSDWGEIWEESNWEIQDNPSRLVHYTGPTNNRSILTWEKPGEVYGDVEVAGLVHVDGDASTFADSANSLFQIHLNSSGMADYENSYYLDINMENGNNNISINRLFGKRLTNLGSEQVDFEVSPNEWYHVVFAREGDALKGKVWPYGTEEPSDWQVESSDIYLDFGDVGVGQSTEEVTNNWAFFSIGAAGEKAERAPEDLIDPDAELPNELRLQTRIAQIEAEKLDEANLTEESWNGISTALESGKELLKGNPSAEEIDNKIDELDEAYNQLQTATIEYETYFDEPLDTSGWVETWRESDWSLKESPSRLVHNSLDTGSGRKLLSNKGTEKIYGDVEVSTVVQATEFNNTLFQLHLHSFGEKENSYYTDLRKNGTMRINRNVNGTFKVLKSEKMPFTVGENQWYNLVLRVEGNVLKGKAWPYGTDEPAEWQVEVEDDSHKNGYMGLGQVGSTSVNEFLFASLATNGENAPRAPRDIIVDKTPLEERVADIENEDLENANLTKESQTEMAAVLESAKALLKKNPTNEEIFQKIDELDEAFNNLQTNTLDYETFFDESIEESGWEDLWKKGDWSLKENPSRLLHSTLDTGAGRKLLAYKETGKIYGDMEVSAVVKANEFNNTLFQLHLYSFGERGSESSYYLDLRRNGSIRINRNNIGGFSNLTSVNAPFSIEEDTWYNTVFRIEGNVLKGKAWLYGTEEPSEWQLEVEDDTHQNGYLGLGHVANTSVNEFLFASLATNGEDAPRASEFMIDKEALEEKVAEIEAADLDENNYTEASWDLLQNAIQDAKELLQSSEATQEEVDQALHQLTKAYEGLKEKDKSVKEALQEKVDEIKAEELDESQYTEESWKALQTALKISEELLKFDKIGEPIIDKALNNLVIAFEELTEK